MSKHFNLLLLGVIVAGLAMGALLARYTTPTPAAAAQAAGAGQGANRTGSPQTGGSAATADQAQTQAGGNSQSRPVNGTVASLDGDTLTVTTQQGDVKVKTTGAIIQKSVDGTADDLKAGQRVTALANQGADGSLTATSLQLVAADAAQRGTLFSGGNAAQGQPQAQIQRQGQSQGQGQLQGQNEAQGQSQGQAQGQGQRQAPGEAGDTSTRPVTGSIVSLEGDILTVNSGQGETKLNVKGARIQKTADGTTADLKAGERVVVMGQAGTDGIVAATSIQVVAAGR